MTPPHLWKPFSAYPSAQEAQLPSGAVLFPMELLSTSEECLDVQVEIYLQELALLLKRHPLGVFSRPGTDVHFAVPPTAPAARRAPSSWTTASRSSSLPRRTRRNGRTPEVTDVAVGQSELGGSQPSGSLAFWINFGV